jgi:hypothetical protein
MPSWLLKLRSTKQDLSIVYQLIFLYVIDEQGIAEFNVNLVISRILYLMLQFYFNDKVVLLNTF